MAYHNLQSTSSTSEADVEVHASLEIGYESIVVLSRLWMSGMDDRRGAAWSACVVPKTTTGTDEDDQRGLIGLSINMSRPVVQPQPPHERRVSGTLTRN